MAKTPRGAQPDPMAREVDRLLAQLGRTAPPAEPNGFRPEGPSRPSGAYPRRRGPRESDENPQGQSLALWSRALLVATLGVVMTQWPYPHECGWALSGYLGAVGMVMLSGSWIAFASWRLHNGLAHLVGLVVIYWGLVLAAEQILPRVGYAAERAGWRCAVSSSIL